jgi:aspartate racemase
MEAKKLGVIGGMGPMATSLFIDQLIKNTDAKRDQDHIDTMILNHATMPDRTEAILNNRSEAFLEAIKRDLEILEFAQVDHIAIPCNTSHFYYDAIQSMTTIPIINMVEKTVEYIKNSSETIGKVGILATNGTVKSDIYRAACQKFGLEVYYPDQSKQDMVMDIIYQYKAGIIKDSQLEEMIAHCVYEEGCSTVVLGCTELSCIPISAKYKSFCIDPMDILVKESIRLSGKEAVSTFEI